MRPAMLPKARALAKGKAKAGAKAKAKVKARAKPKARWPDPGSPSSGDSDGDVGEEPVPQERRLDPAGPPAGHPAALTNATVLRIFRAGALQGGLQQLEQVSALVLNRVQTGCHVSQRDGAVRLHDLPNHPSGYMEFLQVEASVTTLKASCNALGDLLRQPMLVRHAAMPQDAHDHRED